MKKITSGRIPPAGSSPITEQDFRCRMTASLLAILTCLAVMASSAFALFHTEVSSASNTLQSAHYTVNVSPATPYITPPAPNDEHTFIITAGGTASTGYCKVQVGDNDTYYTPAIPQGETLTLVVVAQAGVSVTITPIWGTPPVSTYSLGPGPLVIEHSHTPYAIYVKEEKAQLEGIAEYYGVSQDDILTFNGLTSLDGLPVGQALLIPGVDAHAEPYQVPVETEPVSEANSESEGTSSQ